MLRKIIRTIKVLSGPVLCVCPSPPTTPPPLKTNFTPEIDVPKIIFLSSLEVLKRSPEEEFYKMKKKQKVLILCTHNLFACNLYHLLTEQALVWLVLVPPCPCLGGGKHFVPALPPPAPGVLPDHV